MNNLQDYRHINSGLIHTRKTDLVGLINSKAAYYNRNPSTYIKSEIDTLKLLLKLVEDLEGLTALLVEERAITGYEAIIDAVAANVAGDVVQADEEGKSDIEINKILHPKFNIDGKR